MVTLGLLYVAPVVYHGLVVAAAAVHYVFGILWLVTLAIMVVIFGI